MICEVCREGLEGIWDPAKTKRIGLLRDFPDVMHLLHPDVEDEDGFEVVLNEYDVLEPEQFVFGHHADYDSLLRSKEQGCVTCNQFGEVNDRDDENEHLKELGYYSVFTVNLSRRDIPRPLMTVFSGEPLEQFPHEMVLHDENDSVNAAITPSTSDAMTWVLIETWLERCKDAHSKCATQALGGFTPTRLLELSISGDQRVFRLVSGTQLEPGERYATLSHSWGKGPAEEKLRLLEATERALRDGMPVNTLPLLFRHAFEVISRFEIRYLWIDRLCIVQDSASDWRDEAATMQTVYRNGFLNIAALGARDDRDGCFFERDPARVAPTVFRLGAGGDRRALYRLEAEDESWRSTFVGPLLVRAWVLQERLLAARNLYFGRKQVFWECCEANHCETFPRKMLMKPPPAPGKPASMATQTDATAYAWKSLINAQDKRVRQGSLLDQWDSAVQRYCECSLTFPNDKLVALSGLAKHIGGKLSEVVWPHDTYLAGLWRTSMPRSLLWRVNGQGRKPPMYRAPSWSWASLDGNVIIPVGGPPWYADVVDACVHLQDGDVTGQVAGAQMRLRGPLCLAGGITRSKERRDRRKRIRSFRHPDTIAPMDLDSDSAYVQFDTDDDEYDEVTVVIFRVDPLHRLSLIDCKGLAMVCVENDNRFYRRVGFVTMKINADEDDLNNPREVLHDCPVATIDVL
ncbi:hypothetical protein DL766_004750 [Monosporascus sp. MC13-8B]|uniref:Heterokaryon incompatibility domain-containing protein n=1 Tax=Monosporascus cannonballus TaxID=155416 RepID=A0ABY0H4H7_9PEZI|nr:hypothetical protein DL762_006643 [Monosporascus cannonballus]RYO88482.1 hypothetical protein DL763_005981 [Monosporascus cannonballus]RYP30738.1 hypothetical protein DL766_004750 [Monosporascus sp. MC13-8B]